MHCSWTVPCFRSLLSYNAQAETFKASIVLEIKVVRYFAVVGSRHAILVQVLPAEGFLESCDLQVGPRWHPAAGAEGANWAPSLPQISLEVCRLVLPAVAAAGICGIQN